MEPYGTISYRNIHFNTSYCPDIKKMIVSRPKFPQQQLNRTRAKQDSIIYKKNENKKLLLFENRFENFVLDWNKIKTVEIIEDKFCVFYYFCKFCMFLQTDNVLSHSS